MGVILSSVGPAMDVGGPGGQGAPIRTPFEGSVADLADLASTLPSRRPTAMTEKK